MAWGHGQQAITWDNVGLDLCCHMMSLGHNELIKELLWYVFSGGIGFINVYEYPQCKYVPVISFIGNMIGAGDLVPNCHQVSCNHHIDLIMIGCPCSYHICRICWCQSTRLSIDGCSRGVKLATGHQQQPHSLNYKYRQVSNLSCTLVGNKIDDHSDVVGASPVGAAPTTSSFST